MEIRKVKDKCNIGVRLCGDYLVFCCLDCSVEGKNDVEFTVTVESFTDSQLKKTVLYLECPECGKKHGSIRFLWHNKIPVLTTQK